MGDWSTELLDQEMQAGRESPLVPPRDAEAVDLHEWALVHGHDFINHAQSGSLPWPQVANADSSPTSNSKGQYAADRHTDTTPTESSLNYATNNVAKSTNAAASGWTSHSDTTDFTMNDVSISSIKDALEWSDGVLDQDYVCIERMQGYGHQEEKVVPKLPVMTKQHFAKDEDPMALSSSLSSLTPPNRCRGPGPDMSGTGPDKVAKRSVRSPSYPIMKETVCLEWMRHPGTILWLEAVESFSGNKQGYPEWNDDISYYVQKKLALEKNMTAYLVFRDCDDKRCFSIHDGLWVIATEEEIVETTKCQFLRNRQQPKPTPTDHGLAIKPVKGPSPEGSLYEGALQNASSFSGDGHPNKANSFPNTYPDGDWKTNTNLKCFDDTPPCLLNWQQLTRQLMRTQRRNRLRTKES